MEWSIGPADTWDRLASWLKSAVAELAQRPAAFLIVSAHWETVPVKLTTGDKPGLIYDYYGFPEHTYALTYPVTGEPRLAAEVLRLLDRAGIQAEGDPDRGFDHGVFVPFKLIAPEAEIPVVQLSLHGNLDPAEHLRIGESLASLREQGVLIVGSGLSSHNLGLMMQPDTPLPGAVRFNDWLVDSCALAAPQRNQLLSDWERAPGARETHPREEHLLPLMVCAGAARDDIGRCVFSDEIMGARVVAIQFG